MLELNKIKNRCSINLNSNLYFVSRNKPKVLPEDDQCLLVEGENYTQIMALLKYVINTRPHIN